MSVAPQQVVWEPALELVTSLELALMIAAAWKNVAASVAAAKNVRRSAVRAEVSGADDFVSPPREVDPPGRISVWSGFEAQFQTTSRQLPTPAPLVTRDQELWHGDADCRFQHLASLFPSPSRRMSVSYTHLRAHET